MHPQFQSHKSADCQQKKAVPLDTLREKIIATVEKHPRSPYDLYDACVRGCTLTRLQFRQLLDEMDRDGEIHINSNNRVLLPKPPPEVPPEVPPEAPPTEPVTVVENRTELADMTFDEILAHSQHRSKRKAGDCLKRVEHDAHIDNLSRGIYWITHSGDKQVRTSDFERASFSLMPTKSDGDPAVKYAQYWNTRRKARDWGHNAWRNAYGLQIYMGEASRKTIEGTAYYPICWDIEEGLLLEHPDIFEKVLRWAVAIPDASLLISKSGGLRINAWVTFVRDRSEQMVARREWHDPEDPEKINGTTYAEILSGKGLARIDERYLLAKGRIDEFPVLSEAEFMQPLEWVEPLDARIRKPHATGEAIPALDEGLPDGLSWKQGDKFLISRQRYDCEQDHTSNPTCEYRKHDSGTITKWCWACRLSWKVVEGEPRTDTVPITPTQPTDRSGLEPVTTLPPDHPILNSAPSIEVRETPSFRHFSTEERAVVSSVLSLDPNAGWHGQTPVFTTRYAYLHPLTNKFALNGQPSEVEKRRVWSTLFGKCEICGAVTAQWIDRYLLTAGLYCDGCHKDYALGSYLELELNRKLPSSIVSEHQGFLGDDPEFKDFRLWEPQMLTYLGASMATGKTTELYKMMVLIALQGIGKGIIAVPRVSLARFLVHVLREKYGYRSWGLWHAGCHKTDKFIGDIGAIVCLPSLPEAVKEANDAGVKQLYLAIDEVDFGYNLLALAVDQATAVKKCLRDALNSTGLVVSGQTESTLSLEAFAEEIGAEQVQGFYNTAAPADGSVVMHKHANTDGKSMDILCGGIEDTSALLDEGQNVYVFCSSRRDGDMIADEFQHENPVVYNAYTKGNARADAVLRNQKLTDSRLFVGTSAAGVGISILDPNARTVILNGITYGSRDASMAVQKCVRDRWRCGIFFHYADYDISLPVRPSENEKVSLYHEALKAAASPGAHLSEDAVNKVARSLALSTLADHQLETFVQHHLGKIGNMEVYHASALPQEKERLKAISLRRSEIRHAEKLKRIATAIDFLKQPYLLTTSEIRVLSNQGGLSPDEILAHETANAAAQAVGWDNEIHGYENGKPIKVLPDADNLEIAIELTEQNINTDNLSKQRRGYLACNFPKWTSSEFQTDLQRSDSELVMEGLGLELPAITDDRFLGLLLTKLLDRLTGKVFDSASLATAVREVLNSPADTGKTFGSELESGALGASAYRIARFLHCSDDDFLIRWVRGFVSQWYPARLAKSKDTYALTHADNVNLRLTSFSRWLIHQPSVKSDTQIDLDIFEPTELPDPDAELKKVARFRREGGETIKSIAESLNRNPRTIAKWCKNIKPPSPAQSEILGILADGAVWKRSDIEARTRFARQNITSAFNALLEADKICKPKRGYYQKK